MANTFKNASAVIDATPGTVVYSQPAGATQVVHSLSISNTSVTEKTVTVEVIDQSASSTTRLMSNIPVPAGSQIYFPKPINLEPADQIRIIASDAAVLEAFIQVLQIT